MEAIIKTNDKNIFERVLYFLQLLPITIETKDEKKALTKKKTKGKKYPLEGTVLKYASPFDSSTKISEWEVTK